MTQAAVTTQFTSKEFFDAKYRGAVDPWNFATSVYEQHRYDTVVRSLAFRRHGLAFEPGCSIGVLTEALAPLCDSLIAMDISEVAAASARQRCAHLANVRVITGTITEYLPAQPLDLVVFSEIGYYLTEQALQRVSARLVGQIKPGGTFLAAHWLGCSAHHVLSGDQVHAVLRSIPGLHLEHHELHDAYRLDRWVRE